MKKINHTIHFAIAICACLLPTIANADTVLQFLVKKSQASEATPQTIVIKDGLIMVKAAGGDADTDLLYSRAEESVKIVDHQKRTVMTVDEAEVRRINQQAQGVQPLLQGLGDQIAKLSPQERRKWQEMLGDNISLDKIAKASGSEPQAPIRLASIGAAKVAGIKCQTMRVMQGTTPMGELCVAEQTAIKIPDNDYATIRALLDFYERLSNQTQRLAGQIGFAVPIIAMDKVKGLPIRLRDLSRDEHGSATLRRIETVPVSPQRMSIPGSYAAEPLTLWK